MKKTNSTDSAKLAEAVRGMKIKTPFGADGTITMRAEDQTTIGYALGWGTTIPKEPYVSNITPATGRQSSSTKRSGRRRWDTRKPASNPTERSRSGARCARLLL